MIGWSTLTGDAGTLKVIFAHGKESGPWGFKIRHLAEIARARGCGVESIDYTDLADPDDRVTRLVDHARAETGRYARVGSSMGGYVSLVASAEIDPAAIFLMAPALYMPGFGARQDNYPVRCGRIEIVHGWSDDVIPVENSLRYARESGCAIHVIPGDHPLNTSIDAVAALFAAWLDAATAAAGPGARA